MSSFPAFSNISGYAISTIKNRAGNTFEVSKLNCWVKVVSGIGDGCILYSNPNIALFSAAGDNNAKTIYGSSQNSGVIGVTWEGTTIECSPKGSPGRPSPIVTSLEVDEGAGELSRKAKFTIRCFSVQQLDAILSYYMEPGFCVFLEWGWNTTSGVSGNKVSSAASISKYQSISEVNSYRAKRNGLADVYLGFVVGGNVAVSETYWDVNVKLCGFTELPAYLMAADNNGKNKSTTETPPPNLDYAVNEWFTDDDPKTVRWKFCFNSLPSNRRTQLVKDLEKDKYVNNPVNFINFDKKVIDAINDNKDGGFWGNIFGNDDDIQVADPETGEKASINVDEAVKLIPDERFIRFGTLMAIMNRIPSKAFQIGSSYVTFKINTERCICGAFKHIFSTDRKKLFIPNPQTPAPDFYEIVENTGKNPTDDGLVIDNTVKFGDRSVQFPAKGNISSNKAKNTLGKEIEIYYKDDTTEDITVDEGKWGWLDDLYVNFDFVKGILETKNFLIKDALYQILNGISTAAGGMWDFQIIESGNPKTGILELMVVDMNLSPKTKTESTAVFELSGPNSVFLESSFDMNIGGAMMNQIIGERNKKSINNSSPPATGRLFSSGKQDKILVKIIDETNEGNRRKPDYGQKNEVDTSQDTSDEYKKEVEKKFAQFLEKVCLAPHVDIVESSAKWSDDVYGVNYMCAYDDQHVFETLKIGSETKVAAEEVSILLPIKFSFTVHGVSGIKRGDKFKVSGLPQQYSDKGFFQVTAVKHVLSGMLWKTEVEGGFRQGKA
jgi:hypothetical protein